MMGICACKNYGALGNEHEGWIYCDRCGYPYSARRKQNAIARRKAEEEWAQQIRRDLEESWGAYQRRMMMDPIVTSEGHIAEVARSLAGMTERDAAQVEEALRQCRTLHHALQQDPPPEIRADAAAYKHWQGLRRSVTEFWHALDGYWRHCL